MSIKPQAAAACLGRSPPSSMRRAASIRTVSTPRGRRHADFLPEQSREMTRAEAGAAGQRGQAGVFGRMCGHPTLDFLKRRSADGIGLATPAELKLAAGAFEKHHKLRRDLLGDLAAEILLNQRKRQIEPGCDARGGADLIVVDVKRVDLDQDLRKQVGELFGQSPNAW